MGGVPRDCFTRNKIGSKGARLGKIRISLEKILLRTILSKFARIRIRKGEETFRFYRYGSKKLRVIENQVTMAILADCFCYTKFL